MESKPAPLVFEIRRLPDSDEATLIAEIQRVAKVISHGPLTRELYRQHGRGAKAIGDRFGSWHAALVAAGLGHRSTNAVATPGAQPARLMTDEEILQGLRDLAAQLGTETLTVYDLRGRVHVPFTDVTLRTRWGSAQAAFKAAGLDTAPLGRRYTDDECFANLLAMWTHLGRPPQYREMGHTPSTVGGKAYVKRFGTWMKALHVFVERMNGPAASDSTGPTEAGESIPPQRPAVPAQRQAGEDAHAIPLGLRFRVLHRDKFKCVLCGDHPARNPNCRLHVDHVVPWSKAGKTREDNLRSLCEGCNVGRGNRFLD